MSEIGFGTWQLGADWGDPLPEDTCRDALHAGLDAGINFVDTADIYGSGRSERIVGSVLRERREPVVVATKMGRGPGWEPALSAIRAAARGSLERLGVEVLDLVQLHCVPSGVLRDGAVFEHLETIRREGLIRHYGASVESIEDALFCIRHSGCATLQVIFNLFRQRLIDELFQGAAVNHVGIIARVPLASGVLSGKFSAGHRFQDNDHRAYNADGDCFNVGETFAGVPFPAAVEFASQIREILAAESPDASLAQKALRWILDFDSVSTVIPGATSARQARENAAASSLPRLGEGAHAALTKLYRQSIAPAVRGVY